MPFTRSQARGGYQRPEDGDRARSQARTRSAFTNRTIRHFRQSAYGPKLDFRLHRRARKRVFDSFPSSGPGRIKIESARPNKVILDSPQFPAGTNAGGRKAFGWNKRIQRYSLEGDDVSLEGGDVSDVSTVSPNPLACDKLESAKAETATVLANGDFTQGEVDYPFTHGVGCDCAPSADPGTLRVADRSGRRPDDKCEPVLYSCILIIKLALEVGALVDVFGCVARPVRMVLGSEFAYGATVEKGVGR